MIDTMSVDKAGRPLEAFRIAGLPPDFYYIPNFISVEEEASILQKVHTFRDLANLLTLTPSRSPPSDG